MPRICDGCEYDGESCLSAEAVMAAGHARTAEKRAEMKGYMAELRQIGPKSQEPRAVELRGLINRLADEVDALNQMQYEPPPNLSVCPYREDRKETLDEKIARVVAEQIAAHGGLGK